MNNKKIKLSGTLHNCVPTKTKKNKKNVRTLKKEFVFIYMYFSLKMYLDKKYNFFSKMNFFLHKREARCKLVKSYTKLIKFILEFKIKRLIFLTEQSRSSDRKSIQEENEKKTKTN